MKNLRDDVETELGRPLSEGEGDQVELWQGDMLAEVAERFDPLPDECRMARVFRLAIVARLRSPEPGLVASEVGVDDARVVRRYSSSSAVTLLTPDLWALLGWSAGADLRTIRPSYDLPDPVLPDYPVWPL